MKGRKELATAKVIVYIYVEARQVEVVVVVE